MSGHFKHSLRSQRGVTIVELLAAMVIMASLAGLATLSFRQMQEKADIDEQAKELYADLMKVRSDALFRKEVRSVRLSGTTGITVYATSDGSGTPLWSKTYTKGKAMVSNNTDPVAFDTTGVAGAEKAFCVGGSGNGAGSDSVAISSTSILLGKLSGGDCSSGNINPR